MYQTDQADAPARVVGQDKLSNTLQQRFEEWLRARGPQEKEFVDAYSDAMRISRDDDTKDTGVSKSQKSKLFIGSTRGKIRSARAKIKDALFGAGKMPFDTSPTNEKLKDYTDTFEEILTYQLNEMKFRRIIGGGINALCTYGTGYMFGPFVREKTHTTVDQQQDPYSGAMMLQEVSHTYQCPYFEHGNTMDVYPDPEAKDIESGTGVFWTTYKQPHEVRSWKGLQGYNTEAIDYAMTQLKMQSESRGSDLTKDQRANISRFTKDGRIVVQRYIGLVNRDDLSAWMGQETGSISDDEVEAIIIMAGGVVVKADENPYKNQRRPALRCVYEEVENEFYGVGIAKNNEPHQKVVNAAFRLYMEGKAFALLKTFSADAGSFEVGEDFKLFPGKRFKMKKGLTPEERKTAIIWHDVLDVTAGWENVIGLSQQFSDDDTGITKYTQGSDSSHLNDTATGVSMIMNASSLPLKEVMQNIDELWIEPMIESLIDWNLEYLDPQTVAILLGEKQAQIWAQIRQFGKSNFMEWTATGSSTFMAKEVLMQKLQGFLQLAVSSPLTADKIDVRELLQQVWDAGEIGKESVVYDEETLAQKQQQNGPPPEMQQAMQQMQDMIGQLQAELAQAKQGAEIKVAQIQSNERLKAQELDLKALDVAAGIDLKQAQTVQALTSANLMPDQHMLEVAKTMQPTQSPQ